MTARTPSGILAPRAAQPLSPLSAPPSFSVVIPVYQSAPTVGRAIDSALAQQHPPNEVIVVDDGSTDQLGAALEPFRASIRVLHQENRGAAAARNAGTSAASGDFVAVLDADDTFEPGRLEALASLATARPDLDLIATDARFVVGDGVVGSFAEANPFEIEDQCAAILRSCFVGGWPAVRRTRLIEIGGYDEDLHVAHDWDCWLRLILDGSRAGLVLDPLYNYTLHQGTVTSNRLVALWDRVRLLEKAERNPRLSPAHRPVLEGSLAMHRHRAGKAEVAAFLSGASSSERMRELARLPTTSARVRALALAALVVPWLVRRLVSAEPPPADRFDAPRE